MVEADLAFRGIDLRDLYRKGSGLTPRRLIVLIRCLPYDSVTQMVLAAEASEDEEIKKPSADLLRERQAHYDNLIRGGA